MLPKFSNRAGDREAAEEALERDLLANKFITLFTRETSFSTMLVIHCLQRTAILKLRKLALCPLPAITTQSVGGEGWGEGRLCLNEVRLLPFANFFQRVFE
jgi:hypothetical protein